MPIYEYFCPSCQCKFELLRAMSQSNKKAHCPSCGGKAERALSVFARRSEGLPDYIGSGAMGSSSSSGCSSCSSTNCGSCGL